MVAAGPKTRVTDSLRVAEGRAGAIGTPPGGTMGFGGPTPALFSPKTDDKILGKFRSEKDPPKIFQNAKRASENSQNRKGGCEVVVR